MPSSISRTYSYNISPHNRHQQQNHPSIDRNSRINQIHPIMQRHPPIPLRIQLRLFNRLPTLPIRHPHHDSPDTPTPQHSNQQYSTPPQSCRISSAACALLLHHCSGPGSRRDAIRGKRVIVVVVARRLRQPQDARAGAAREDAGGPVAHAVQGEADALDVVRGVGDGRVGGGCAYDVDLGAGDEGRGRAD